MKAIGAAVVIALVSVAIASSAHAQVRASERSTLSQVIDGTRITVDYARPRVRGRTIFGNRVHWGEVWTPGANWATTLDVGRDVMIDSNHVAKGIYSVWFIAGPEHWTVVLDPQAKRYHTEPPDSAAGQVRWTVRPDSAATVEFLTFSFPTVRPDGGTLLFEWADRRVPFNVSVAPSHPITLAADAAAPYIGKYVWSWTEDKKPITLELYHDGSMLRQRHTPAPDWYPLLQDQPMVRINDGWFIPAIIRDGKVWEMVADMIFEFEVVNGKAIGFELRDDRDELMGTGVRVGDAGRQKLGNR